MSLADDVLKHHGIRGMKWGVRRSSPSGSSGAAESVKVKSRPGKGVVKTSGGGRQPASEDAKRAAASLQKARASSTDALSNQELSHLNQRLQLEQKFSQLSSSRNARHVSNGRKFVNRLMKVPSTVQTVHSYANSPAGKAIQKAIRQGSGKHAKP